jgi:putative FmdB family regulatory protein
MPLYEYECKKCGHRFEKIQKFSDKMVKKCPECGGRVEQMISAPAVQFKGSGWYVTDYPKKSGGSSGSSSSSESKDSKESKEAKESKESKKDEKKTESSQESSSKKAEKNK